MKITRVSIVVVLGILLSTIFAGSAGAQIVVPYMNYTYPQTASTGCLVPCTVQTVANAHTVDPNTGEISYDVTVEWDFDGYPQPGFQTQAVGSNATWTYQKKGSYVILLRLTNSKGETDSTSLTTVGVVAPLSSTVVTPKLERVIAGKSDTLISTLEFTPMDGGRWTNTLELQKKHKGKRIKGSKKRKTYPWITFRTNDKQGAFVALTTPPRLRPVTLSLRAGKKKMLKLQKRGYKFRAVATYVLTDRAGQVAYQKQLVKYIKFKKAKKKRKTRS